MDGNNSLYMVLCSNGGRKNSLVRFSAGNDINLAPNKEGYVLWFVAFLFACFFFLFWLGQMT